MGALVIPNLNAVDMTDGIKAAKREFVKHYIARYYRQAARPQARFGKKVRVTRGIKRLLTPPHCTAHQLAIIAHAAFEFLLFHVIHLLAFGLAPASPLEIDNISEPD